MRTLTLQQGTAGPGQPHAPVDVAALIDAQPMSRAQVPVAVLCALAVFFDGYDIQVIALAVPALAQEWGLAPSRFGMALAAVVGITLGTALQSPLGILALLGVPVLLRAFGVMLMRRDWQAD